MAAKSMEDIALFLKELRFRKNIFGGVNEADVWKKLELLHQEYQTAFDVQQECSRILLQEKELEIVHLKERITELESARGVGHE